MERILRRILIPSFQQFPQNPCGTKTTFQKYTLRLLQNKKCKQEFCYLFGFLLTFFLLYKNFLSIWISLLKPSFCSHFQRQFLLPQLASETGHKTREIATFVRKLSNKLNFTSGQKMSFSIIWCKHAWPILLQ